MQINAQGQPKQYRDVAPGALVRQFDEGELRFLMKIDSGPNDPNGLALSTTKLARAGLCQYLQESDVVFECTGASIVPIWDNDSVAMHGHPPGAIELSGTDAFVWGTRNGFFVRLKLDSGLRVNPQEGFANDAPARLIFQKWMIVQENELGDREVLYSHNAAV